MFRCVVPAAFIFVCWWGVLWLCDVVRVRYSKCISCSVSSVDDGKLMLIDPFLCYLSCTCHCGGGCGRSYPSLARQCPTRIFCCVGLRITCVAGGCRWSDRWAPRERKPDTCEDSCLRHATRREQQRQSWSRPKETSRPSKR